MSLDNRIPPPVVAVLTATAMVAASRLLPPGDVPSTVRLGVMGVLLVVAAAFGAPAFASFKRAGTTINPVRIESASSLVTSGVYRVSRNPMYVGLAALLLALAAVLARAWLLAGPLAFVLYTTRFQIIPEERIMLAKFGDAYAAYRGRTRRWL